MLSTKKTVNPSEYWVVAGADSSAEWVAFARTTCESVPTGGSGFQNRSASAKSRAEVRGVCRIHATAAEHEARHP